MNARRHPKSVVTEEQEARRKAIKALVGDCDLDDLRAVIRHVSVRRRAIETQQDYRTLVEEGFEPGDRVVITHYHSKPIGTVTRISDRVVHITVVAGHGEGYEARVHARLLRHEDKLIRAAKQADAEVRRKETTL